MGIDQLIQTLFENGGLLGLALFSIWQLNRVWSDRVETEKAHGKNWETMAKENQEVIKANTKAITILSERLEPRDCGD